VKNLIIFVIIINGKTVQSEQDLLELYGKSVYISKLVASLHDTPRQKKILNLSQTLYESDAKSQIKWTI
jgi:hypothetical protein